MHEHPSTLSIAAKALGAAALTAGLLYLTTRPSAAPEQTAAASVAPATSYSESGNSAPPAAVPLYFDGQQVTNYDQIKLRREQSMEQYIRQSYENSEEYREAQYQDLAHQARHNVDEDNLEDVGGTMEDVDQLRQEGAMVW